MDSHQLDILVELFKRGEYDELDLFDKQLEALKYLEDDETNEALYGGAARGGKSVLGCEWQLFRRLSMPNSYGLIAREEYSKLRDTTLLTFYQTLKKYGLKKDIDFKASGIPVTIEFKNGSRIFFREIKYIPSDPEFDRLGSYDLTDAFLDEAQQIHFKATQVLKGRFSVVECDEWKTIPKILYTCNPAKTWVWSEFVRPHKENVLPNRLKFIKALPSDNPFVPQSFFDNLETADEITKQRLLYGNFEYDDDPSILCEYDAICDLFTNDHIQGGNKTISADLAMQGRDKFIAGYWDGMICNVAVDIPKCGARDIELALRELKTANHVGNTQIVADSDGLGAYLEDYIKNIKSFHGGASPKNKKEFGNLKDECAFKLSELINNREIKIVCSPQQQENIKEEISICLKRDNVDADVTKKKIIKKDKMKKDLRRSPDYLDMLIMAMIFIIKPKRQRVY